MQLLIDENLSPRLARWACDYGYPAEAAVHVGLAGAPDSSALYAVWRCGNSVELKDSTCSMASHEAPESPERQTEMFHLFHLLPILPGCAKSSPDPLRTTDPWQLEPKP